MRKTPIQIRVDAVDLEAWQRKASEAGQNLSEWIRERCNGEVSQTEKRERVARLPSNGGVRLVEGRIDSVERVEKVVSGKACKHGVAKSWHCWQCGGMAVIDAHD